MEINPKGRQLDRFFAACHDYLLVYAEDASRSPLNRGLPVTVDPQDFPMKIAKGAIGYFLCVTPIKKSTRHRSHYELPALRQP
ncbi:MAG: hypothetical protein U1U88_002159 [Lawsonella clevelandensis]